MGEPWDRLGGFLEKDLPHPPSKTVEFVHRPYKEIKGIEESYTWRQQSSL